MKKCFKCGEVKPLADYYKHKSMSDGHLNKCKECTKNDVHKHRGENIEKVRAYDRNRPNKAERSKRQAEYHKAGKGYASHLLANKEYRLKNPLRYKANNALNNALRDGRIYRPSRCSVCDIECKPHGHHDDYTKPLSVRWLCVGCHNKFHNFMRELFRNLEHTGIVNPF